uniref:lactate racemase domain-containing protein n=1 Tax=Vaginimicrobium propionicum TaxID=1871034 RepID=UPI000970AC3F|nr:lactate racemase domain-containing protein [Vaginimicrobium propionicum]
MTIELTSLGEPGYKITPEEFDGFVGEAFSKIDVAGKNVVLIIPDDTRSCPLAAILKVAYKHLIDRVGKLSTVIALGTHEYMEPDEIALWTAGDAKANLDEVYPGMEIVNHLWKDDDELVSVGEIPAERIYELSGKRLKLGSDVLINRRVVEADVKIIIGPILPHEVVGISGGNKYFIPGCAKEELINLTHWVGALITSAKMIGTPGVTPVRAMINEGASMIPGEKYCLAFVVKAHESYLESVAFGSPEDAWADQAQVTAQTHIRYVAEPLKNVISEIPERYHDIWTAAKGFYKTEPAVADGGEVIIYAPHITEVSEAHEQIYRIGYHCRDYFVGQWDKFKDEPWGVLAHSTHLRGAGTYNAETGEEKCRLQVTLATQIPKEVCESINLGYRDPKTIPELMKNPDYYVVHDAGEVLFRLESERPKK